MRRTCSLEQPIVTYNASGANALEREKHVARPRKVDVGGWSGAMRAHDYWIRALDAPDADKVTSDPKAARAAFDAITTISADAMEAWLARWPNSLGWRRYRAAMRQADHSRQHLTKIALRCETASRLRSLAERRGLSLDQTVSRLLDLARLEPAPGRAPFKAAGRSHRIPAERRSQSADSAVTIAGMCKRLSRDR